MSKQRLTVLILALAVLSSLVASSAGAAAPTAPADTSGVSPQDAPATKTYLWEEYGITFTLPDTWQTVGKSQNFDLALVAPGVMESGQGAFIMLQVFASLGAGTTPEVALGPLASQVNSTVEEFSAAGLTGFGVTFNDEQSGTVGHLILLPYGESGALLFAQTSATPDEDATVLGILDSMIIDPPKLDYAAVDAAWQASLAEQGRLIYGESDAPISMVEYLSFTCGHCANYSLPIEHLIALEAQSGRVRIELAPLAGDDLATRATQATFCAAEQGKGYSAYKALFNGYLTIGYQEAYSKDGVRNLLEPLGLDMDALNACMDSKAYDNTLAAIRKEFIDNGLTGTPTVMLGANGNAPETLKFPDGQVWSGTIPIEILRSLFDMITEQGMTVSEATTRFFGG
ncbi:MAG: DsbA family protein [Aggregatilineaceae bacterium]